MPAGLAARWLRRPGRGVGERRGEVDREPGSDGHAGEEAGARFYRFTTQQFHSLLRQALRVLPAKQGEQEREIGLLDDLRDDLQAFEDGLCRDESRYEVRLSDGCRRLSEFIEEQRNAALLREQELSDVLTMLTQNMADFTSENAGLYEDIRAENARIVEASRQNDLRRLRSILREATERLTGVVAKKESLDQSRIEALSTQVEALKSELSEVRRQADLDPLTQQLNRRCFDEILSALVMRCRGTRRGFAMIIFDLDDFKAINDHYGHAVGDRAIIAFARYCRTQLRSKDSFARIGGEEFAVLLEGATLRSALRRATKICEGLGEHRYTVDEAGEQFLTLTVSAGVAAFRRDDSELSVFKRADGALYEAKALGKNRAIGA